MTSPTELPEGVAGAVFGPKFRLKRLKIAEVSAVDRPANPGARIALIKRDGALTPVTILKDGAAIYAPPAGSGLERGQTIKAAEPPTPDHAATGHVVSDGFGGLAVRFGKRTHPDLSEMTRRAAAVEQKLNSITAPPTAATKERNAMSDQERMEKAAHKNMADWADRSEWATAMRKRAADNRLEGETVEMAQRRLFKSDATMQAMRQCYEVARPAPAPTPEPTTKAQRNGPEAKLEALAQDYAKTNNVSMVDARAAVARSPEGRRIRAEAE
jgi:hypothetical protein